MKAYIRVSTLVAFATLAVGSVRTATAQDLTPQEDQKARAAVERARPAKMELVLREFTGTFDDIGQQMKTLADDIHAAQLEIARSSTPVVVVYEDPEGKQSYRLAVGLQLAKSVKAKGPLKVESVNLRKVAKYSHQGREYKRLGRVYAAISRHAKAKKQEASFPAIMRLITENDTELLVPLSSS